MTEYEFFYVKALLKLCCFLVVILGKAGGGRQRDEHIFHKCSSKFYRKRIKKAKEVHLKLCFRAVYAAYLPSRHSRLILDQ